MQISLARAFKERARLNQKIIAALSLIKEENSLVEGGVRSVDVRKKYQEFHDLSEKMIKLKQTISHANAGIEDKLVELGEKLYFAAGSDKNIKLTTKDDLEMFKGYIKSKNEKWLK